MVKSNELNKLGLNNKLDLSRRCCGNGWSRSGWKTKMQKWKDPENLWSYGFLNPQSTKRVAECGMKLLIMWKLLKFCIPQSARICRLRVSNVASVIFNEFPQSAMKTLQIAEMGKVYVFMFFSFPFCNLQPAMRNAEPKNKNFISKMISTIHIPQVFHGLRIAELLIFFPDH